jgi:hypothetical protein
MPTTAAKSGAGGGLKRAAIIIVGDEILKGETQVFTTTANQFNKIHYKGKSKTTETLSPRVLYFLYFEKIMLTEYVLIFIRSCLDTQMIIMC